MAFDADPPRARACPICGAPPEPHYTPFCSSRCANVDLLRWLNGSYVVPGEPLEASQPDTSEDGDGNAAGQAERREL